MLEFIFDSTRAVSNLVFSGTLSRYPDIEWVFTHGGGTLPLLADRMELFRRALAPAAHDEPSVPEQVARLWFDMAGPRFRARCRRWSTRSDPNGCCTAATTAGPRPLPSGSRPPPSTPQASPTATRGAP